MPDAPAPDLPLTSLARDTRRPRLRGYIHLLAATAAPAGLWLLLDRADSPRAYVGAAVAGSAILLLFSISAIYHRLPARSRLRPTFRLLDHGMIFAAIAAIYTPFCLQALDLRWGIPVLATTGGLGLAAVLVRALLGVPSWAVPSMYALVGWTALVGAPQLLMTIGLAASVKLLAAAGLYTVGAAVFATRWPSPFPSIFGHHEVFHLCVTAATAAMAWVIWTDILPR